MTRSGEGLSRYQRDVLRELECMGDLGMASAQKVVRAQEVVTANSDTFNDSTVMSVSEGASLALELA
jgi:hypothetical protein